MPTITTANLYRRGRIWQIDAYYDDGTRRQLTTRTSDEAQARAALDEALRLARAGGELEVEAGDWTVRRWGRAWNTQRREAGKLAWKDEAGHLSHHIYPTLGARPLAAVTRAEMLAWVRALPARPRADGQEGPLSPRTVAHVAHTCRALWRAAVKRGLVDATPCVWDASDLPQRQDVDPELRLEAGLTLEQVKSVISDRRIPEVRRVLYALELLTGMRMGEAAVRRWRDWHPAEKPLGRLVAASAWSTRHHLEKPTKTRVVKWIPVHPVLDRILRVWLARGWARTFGRPPEPADLIAPASEGGARNNGYSWRCWDGDLRRLGLAAQRHYETRSTFRSLALAGGADLYALDLITHPSPRQARDLYSRRRLLWPRLCDAVLAIRLNRDAVTVRTAVSRHGGRRAAAKRG